MVFDLQMKMRSHKTCLKEMIKPFFDLAYHGVAPEKVFVQHMVFDLQMKMRSRKTCLPETIKLIEFRKFFLSLHADIQRPLLQKLSNAAYHHKQRICGFVDFSWERMRQSPSTEKMKCMKDILLGNICWHPTSVVSKIAQSLHTIEENTPLMVFDLHINTKLV